MGCIGSSEARDDRRTPESMDTEANFNNLEIPRGDEGGSAPASAPSSPRSALRRSSSASNPLSPTALSSRGSSRRVTFGDRSDEAPSAEACDAKKKKKKKRKKRVSFDDGSLADAALAEQNTESEVQRPASEPEPAPLSPFVDGGERPSAPPPGAGSPMGLS